MSTYKQTKEAKAYIEKPYPITFYPAEEGGYVAEIEDLPGCLTQGETLAEAAEAIDECKVAWIETALEDGIEIPAPRTETDYSGKFVLRVPKSLHRRLASRARQDGVSLNVEVATLLAGALEAKDETEKLQTSIESVIEHEIKRVATETLKAAQMPQLRRPPIFTFEAVESYREESAELAAA